MSKNRSRGARIRRVGLCFGLLAVGALGAAALPQGETQGVHARIAGPAEAFAFQGPDGKKIYETLCAACHQANGAGVPGMFPPVASSDWVVDDEGRIIRVLLHGLTGEIEVNGQSYAGTMPPFGSALKDAELAAVATYLRTSLGNEAQPVKAATVARVRTAEAARKKPWTGKELDELLKK